MPAASLVQIVSTVPASIRPEAVYRPYGETRAVFHRRDREIVLSGPAGTGKSRAALEKLHLLACKYPGCRLLIVRKTRKSLTQTGLVTFEKQVLVGTGIRLHHESQEYRYPNGSVVVVGGLDDPTKIMSGDYDVVYVQEASEASLADWEMVMTRLRYGVVPYQQIIGDTNPHAPTHWLKQREVAGKLVMLYSVHQDNPLLYDHEAETWTPRGLEYLATLDALTGVRYKRLRLGLWVAAEGQVYDTWDPALHLLDRFPIPPEWPRYISIDFGYTQPFVAQWWAMDKDGRLYLYRELYHTQRTVEQHARQMADLTVGAREHIVDVVCDHDAEDAATLRYHLFARIGIPTKRPVAAIKAISPGIQAVQARLARAGDGKPRLFILRDSLVEPDADLAARAHPLCTVDEIESYCWPDLDGPTKPVKHGEVPVDAYNHAMDAMRYVVAAVDLAPARHRRAAAFG